MVTIDLYYYPNRRDTVNKQLTEKTPVDGLIYNETNLLSPVVKIRWNSLFTFNYCYINALNRYYHIDKFRLLETGVYELNLSVDVLKTYEQQIMSATATVNEKEQANRFISSRSNIYDVRPNFEFIQFPQSHFTEDGTIILVALKGNI